MSGSPYLQQVHLALPRVLASFDRDPTSRAFGIGDRHYWAWKLIDFPNGTFQGAAGGLARLTSAGLLPEWLPESSALRRIDGCFAGTAAITSRNGSLDEALPHEASFCVTALVAAELLDALRLLEDRIDEPTRRRWLGAVAPLARFLRRQDEHHGLISNHLATAAWSLFLWSEVSGQSDDSRGRLFLDRILRNQSVEGWCPEYGGMDPGYQTWCLGSLAEIHALRPDLEIGDRLAAVVEFLSYCAHPDGSFGGPYGSRMTRFLLPGLEALSGESPTARSLASFSRRSIAEQRCVTLASIDAPNMAPFFNDYCRAAAWELRGTTRPSTGPNAKKMAPLPCERPAFRKRFDDAGLLVDRGADHYTIVALRKGGLFVHCRDGEARRTDPGFVGRLSGGTLVSTQLAYEPVDVRVEEKYVEIVSRLRPIVRPFPNPMSFLVLRVLSLTVFRSLRLGNLVKRLLARYLVSRNPRAVGRVRRRIQLGPKLQFDDRLEDVSADPVADAANFSAIHMASQGYWQRSDDEP